MMFIYLVYGYKILISLLNGRKLFIRFNIVVIKVINLNLGCLLFINLLVIDYNKGIVVVYIFNIRIIENKILIIGEILFVKNNDGIVFEYKFFILERIVKCIIIVVVISVILFNILL